MCLLTLEIQIMKKNTAVIPVGKVLNHEVTVYGLFIELENACLRVIARTDTVLRITYSDSNTFDDFSYAVVDTLYSNASFQVSETKEHLSLHTTSLHWQINFETGKTSIHHVNDHTWINGDDFAVTRIGTAWTAYRQLVPFEKFIGLGEKTGNLDKWGKSYTMWTTDSFGYGTETDPIYASIPFFIGLHNGNEGPNTFNHAYGIFVDNTYRSSFNFGASNKRFASITVADGDLNYYFIANAGTHLPHNPEHNAVAAITRQYSHLTGSLPMPPKWALGLQQCRYSYYPDDKVLQIARSYREKDIPCDVIYLDIHYMDDYKVFTWHPTRFPNPKKLIAELNEMGFKVVLIIDPGIKAEGGYAPYDEGLKQDLFLKYHDDSVHLADVWPGTCAFPDFTNPDTRAWWATQFKQLVDEGIAGFWNDMNEPASWGQATPDNVLFDYDGNTATHLKGRNVYGLQMARATQEGTQNLLEQERTFVLTRAGYAGIQRFAAMWTGDNTASAEHLLLGSRMMQGMSVSGLSFVGTDIGGFVGEPSKELFIRWMQMGTFSPLCRLHTMIGNRDNEPWSYGEEAEAIARNYIKLRYKLMPYIYSAMYNSHAKGHPLVQPWLPQHELGYQHHLQNQYWFGDALLVCPVTEGQVGMKIAAPMPMYSLYGDGFTAFGLPSVQHFNGLEQIIMPPLALMPVLVRAGSVIPMAANDDPSTLELWVFPSIDPSTKYETQLYDDDGHTLAYQEGEYYLQNVHLQGNRIDLFAPIRHTYKAWKQIKVIITQPNLLQVKLNGEVNLLQQENISLMGTLPNFDPYGAGAVIMPSWQASVLTIPFTNEHTVIEF